MSGSSIRPETERSAGGKCPPGSAAKKEPSDRDRGAARAIAEEFFDAGRVLTDLLAGSVVAIPSIGR